MKPIKISGFRGLHLHAQRERIQALPTPQQPLVDLTEGLNIDLDDTGEASRRAGQELRVAGPTHSLWSNGDTCLYVQAGMMFELTREFDSIPLAIGLSEAPVAYAEAGERIYHANGTSAAVYAEGRVRSWGIPIAWADAAATALAGGMLTAGSYQFTMTLLRSDGQESGAGLARRIDLAAGSGLRFSWEVPADPDITEAALYLSAPNGEALYQAAVVPVELGHYDYIGGDRSLELATQWLDQPPVGSALVTYKGRIYIAVGDVLYATSPLSYEHCDLRDYRAFDGSEIRLLAAVESGIFVGTAKRLYFLAGASFAANSLLVKAEGGAIAGTAVMADGADVVGGDSPLAGQAVALMATEAGVFLGQPDGTLQNLTSDRYSLAAASRGAALFRTGTATQYLACLAP